MKFGEINSTPNKNYFYIVNSLICKLKIIIETLTLFVQITCKKLTQDYQISRRLSGNSHMSHILGNTALYESESSSFPLH